MSDTYDDPDLDLGSAALILLEAGRFQPAALLLDARVLRLTYLDTGFLLPLDDRPPFTLWELTLSVPRHVVERFTDELCSEIIDAYNEVLQARGGDVIRELVVLADVPGVSEAWRDDLARKLAPDVVNQATIGPPLVDPIREDRCAFRSREELKVYRALKRARDRLPADDTISIAPNAALVTHASTWEPDFIVTYRGRAGVVEVDGPHHRGRAAADASKDRILKHSGFAEVDRFTVEDSDSDADLDLLVEMFLKRLGSS